jgi:hypothetical protein
LVRKLTVAAVTAALALAGAATAQPTDSSRTMEGTSRSPTGQTNTTDPGGSQSQSGVPQRPGSPEAGSDRGKGVIGSERQPAGEGGLLAGQRRLNQEQVRTRLTEQGYSEIQGLEFRDNAYHATARQGGQSVRLRVDPATGEALVE